MIAQADIHGAISIVNAIATGRGATLGVDLNVRTRIEAGPGSGIHIRSENRSLSSRLITRTVEKSVPGRELRQNRFDITLDSEIPTGYGLKSSSAISSSVALACAGLFGGKISDARVLSAGVDASIETGVSVTGAYDDACACYYGGFVVTDNTRRKVVYSQRAPPDLAVVIFIPRSRRRGNVKKLRASKPVFARAWDLARGSDYWNAMILNGFAASPVLGPDPGLITELVGKGALGASVSGNGPAVAAVARRSDASRIRRVFSALDGRTVVLGTNNRKAEVHEV